MPKQYIRQAEKYRNWIREAVTTLGLASKYGDIFSNEKLFRQLLNDEYAILKTHLSDLISQNVPESDLQGHREVLFVIAIGQFVYGHLDVVNDILDNLPPRSETRVFVQCLEALTPMQTHFSPYHDTGKQVIRSWFQENRDNLEWKEQEAIYVFKNTTE